MTIRYGRTACVLLLASACLLKGSAHADTATLKNEGEVVVKVLRPGMREVIDLDLQVLEALARLADRFWPEARQVRPIEVVSEYRKTILDELDLLREAANAAQLKRNFAGSALLYVPVIYWDYCRLNVLVMERIHGIPISDMEKLRSVGADIALLAENGVRIFFTQVFRHNFFHADMHPGNIFVTVDDPRTYTKPWNARWTMRWVPDQEIQEFFCEEKTS